MPTNTDITQSGSTSGSERPVVYLVNADGEQGTPLNLPLLLAPLWRWRWVIICGTCFNDDPGGRLGVDAARKEVLRQIVVRRGVISAPHFKSQLENLIIPGALNAMDPLWRPNIEIIDRTLSEEDDADKPTVAPDLSTLSFPLHPTDPEQTATLAALLRNRLNDLSADSIALAEVEHQSTQLALNQSLSRAQRAYTLVSDDQYVNTLRGEIERDISLTVGSHPSPERTASKPHETLRIAHQSHSSSARRTR